jgi:transcriptional regulator with XRE-family HTH domain
MSDVVHLDPRGRRPRPLLRTMLGDVLRRRRLAQGRTLADVARAARVSTPYLSEVERGRKEASSEVLAAVCEALGIELSEVLADVGELARRPVQASATVIQLGRPRANANSGNSGGRAGHGRGDVLLLAA